MVDVAMRDQHLLERGAGLLERREQPVDLAAGVDERGALGGRADDDRAVLLERRDGDDGELHGCERVGLRDHVSKGGILGQQGRLFRTLNITTLCRWSPAWPVG